MKQIILIISLSTFFFKSEDKLNENYKLEEARTRHSVCKELGLSGAHLVADILDEEPRVSVFLIYYNECMGFKYKFLTRKSKILIIKPVSS